MPQQFWLLSTQLWLPTFRKIPGGSNLLFWISPMLNPVSLAISPGWGVRTTGALAFFNTGKFLDIRFNPSASITMGTLQFSTTLNTTSSTSSWWTSRGLLQQHPFFPYTPKHRIHSLVKNLCFHLQRKGYGFRQITLIYKGQSLWNTEIQKPCPWAQRCSSGKASGSGHSRGTGYD